MELTENIERQDLTTRQRSAMRARRGELLRELMALAPPSNGGRGKTGGLRQAARAAEMPETTARREAKLRQNRDSRAVSPDPPAPREADSPGPIFTAPSDLPRPSARLGHHQLTIRFTIADLA